MLLNMKIKTSFRLTFSILLFIPCYLFPQLKFAWITDTHIGSPNATDDVIEIIQDLNKRDVKFTILTGDITEKGKNSELIEAKRILTELTKPYFIIPGNHDTKWSESGCTLFKNLFGENRFYFIYEDYVFIGLNSGIPLRGGGGHIPIEELIWLNAKLEKLPKNSKIILAVHHPLDNDIDNSFEIINRLKKFDYAFILVGHGHANREYNFYGINGAMGRSALRGNKTPGYNLVTLKEDSIFIEEVNLIERKPWYKNSIMITNKTKHVYLTKKIFRHRNADVHKIFDTKLTLVKTGVSQDGLIYFADLDGNVYAINQKGKLIWKRTFHTSFFANPSIHKNQVIVCGTNGFIYFLHRKNGNILKKIDVNSTIIASPVINKGKNLLIVFSNDGYVNYINPENFEIKRKKVSDLNFEAIPLYIDNKIILGSWDNYLYSIPDYFIETLQYYWRWTEYKNFYYSPAACSPVIDKQNRIFISTPDKFISAIDIHTGKTIWRSNEYNAWESIGINQEKNVIFIKSVIDTIFALSLIDSIPKLLWKNGIGYGVDTNPVNLFEAQNKLFIPAKNGTLYILDSKDGHLITKFNLGYSRLNNIVPVSKNVFIISNMDGDIFRIKLK